MNYRAGVEVKLPLGGGSSAYAQPKLATEAAFPGLAVRRIEAETKRKHASLPPSNASAVAPGSGRSSWTNMGPLALPALVRRVCAGAAKPGRLAVTATRRVHAITHTKCSSCRHRRAQWSLTTRTALHHAGRNGQPSVQR